MESTLTSPQQASPPFVSAESSQEIPVQIHFHNVTSLQLTPLFRLKEKSFVSNPPPDAMEPRYSMRIEVWRGVSWWSGEIYEHHSSCRFNSPMCRFHGQDRM